MALSQISLAAITPYLKGAHVLSLSYPDLAVSQQEVEAMLGVKVSKWTNQGPRHGKGYELPETMHVMKQVCASFECVDVAKLTGHERVMDLNYPQDLGEYDLVIDPGTLEHCFNIGQALMTAAGAVKVGGRILHLSPMTMMNHGFWNICPTLYHDFYTQNGFEIDIFEVHSKDKEGGLLVGQARGFETKRFVARNEAGLCVLARRVRDCTLTFPVQTKYKPILEKAA
jgi:hypothetical protein